MSSSAVARLVVGSLFAVGAVTLAAHLAAEPVSSAAEVPSSSATAAGRAGTTYDVAPSATLTGAPGRPSATRAATVPGSDTRSVLESTLSRPEPVPTGPGPADLDAAKGVIRGFERLGPVHVDPVPAGVSLDDPTDTASLYARAGVDRPVGVQTAQAQPAPVAAAPLLAADRAAQPLEAASTVPPGTPSTNGLTQHVAPSCSGTGTDGKRVQVLYVRETTTTSRYTDLLPLFRNEIANVDDVFAVSARQSGGERRVRWVHDNCVPVVTEVVVPAGSLDANFGDTITALSTLGYADSNRKYLAFTEARKLCGVGTMYDDARATGNANDGYGASYARVDTGCWSTRDHSVAAHELTHMLGGVLRQAPHATTYGHCYDESDLMCYDDGSGIVMRSACASAHEQLLDCNGDDYFNTAPPAGSFLANNWNTARSGFLDTPTSGGPTGTGPDPATDPVAGATTWSPPSVTSQDPAVLSAVLRDATSGSPLLHAVVELQTRTDPGEAWATAVAGLLTRTDGTVSVERRRTHAAWYRFSYAGDATGTHASSWSGDVFVKGRTTAKADWHGRRHLVTGRLLTIDREPLAHVTVTLERRYAGSSRWVSVTRATSDRDGRLKVKQHPRHTAYFRWSYRGSEMLLPARSASVRATRSG